MAKEILMAGRIRCNKCEYAARKLSYVCKSDKWRQRFGDTKLTILMLHEPNEGVTVCPPTILVNDEELAGVPLLSEIDDILREEPEDV
jgi:hypothetical protein